MVYFAVIRDVASIYHRNHPAHLVEGLRLLTDQREFQGSDMRVARHESLIYDSNNAVSNLTAFLQRVGCHLPVLLDGLAADTRLEKT